MAEENKQKENAPASTEKREHNHHNRRNRHRRGGNRPRPEEGVREGNQSQAPKKPDRQADRPAGGEQKPNRAAQPPQGNKNEGQNGNRSQNNHNNNNKRNNNRRNHKGGDRRTQERRPFDPYEAPSKEERELSELRARIVIKSADESAAFAPTAPTPPTAEEMAAAAAILDAPAEAVKEDGDRVEVVGIRFRSAGKTYYFDPRGIRAEKGDFAVVETTRGPEFGEVRLANSLVPVNETVTPLRPLLRIATPADIAHNEENREKEKKAMRICREKIESYKLDMSLIEAQYAFDNSKLLFYFTSEGRVDFRDLVKDLASVFRTRIELRQIGIRDEAKMLGGIGACGRALCCSTFLPDFAQVSIKMAKEQNLSLNTTKISGVCGRLMCCLRFESDVYVEEIRKTPQNDSLVRTEDGVGVVIGSNPLAGTVRVLLKEAPDTAPKQYHRDSVTVIGKENRSDRPKKNDQKDEANAKAGTENGETKSKSPKK